MGDINLWVLIVVKLSELGILKRYIYILPYIPVIYNTHITQTKGFSLGYIIFIRCAVCCVSLV